MAKTLREVNPNFRNLTASKSLIYGLNIFIQQSFNLLIYTEQFISKLTGEICAAMLPNDVACKLQP